MYVASVVVESACRLCGFATEAGTIVHPARRFREEGDVLAALTAWAADEGEPDLTRFCESSFNGLRPPEIAARILRGEAVETGFDVIAFLFPQAAMAVPPTRRDLGAALRGGVGGDGRGGAAAVPSVPSLPAGTIIPWEALPEVSGRAADRPSLPPPPPPEEREDPYATCRALWSVALADGRTDPREDKLVAAICAELGVGALPRDAARVWRPGEVARPADPGRVLAAMERVARVDGLLDRSEIRVLKEYARAWGVPVPAGRWRAPGVWDELRAGVLGR